MESKMTGVAHLLNKLLCGTLQIISALYLYFHFLFQLI